MVVEGVDLPSWREAVAAARRMARAAPVAAAVAGSPWMEEEGGDGRAEEGEGSLLGGRREEGVEGCLREEEGVGGMLAMVQEMQMVAQAFERA